MTRLIATGCEPPNYETRALLRTNASTSLPTPSTGRVKKLDRDSRNSQKRGNAHTSRTESHDKVADPSSHTQFNLVSNFNAFIGR